MKYRFKICRIDARVAGAVAAAIPESFSFEEEDKQLLLVVNLEKKLTDDEVRSMVQRECDRVAFLTGDRMKPTLVDIECDNGRHTISDTRGARTKGFRPLPTGVGRQDWHCNPNLALQLRLWDLAQLPHLPIAAKILLLFQIVEVTYPDTTGSKDYPDYRNSACVPHPRTEAKLLRHIAVHGKMKSVRPQLERYRQHLGIPVASVASAVSHDPTDSSLIRVLHDRVRVVREEAEKIIASAILNLGEEPCD